MPSICGSLPGPAKKKEKAYLHHGGCHEISLEERPVKPSVSDELNDFAYKYSDDSEM